MRVAMLSMMIAAGAGLSGCTSTVSDSGQAVPTAGNIQPLACNVSRAEGFVGKPGDAVAEDARAAAGAKAVRVIGPNQAVTMDYRGDRLNLEVDAGGTVVKVRCG